MNKLTMTTLVINLQSGGLEFEVEIHNPGIVRQCLVQAKEKSILEVSAFQKHNSHQPQVEFSPVMLIEIDPDAPKRKRNFALLPQGKIIQSEQSLVYQGTFIHPGGELLHLYEEVITADPREAGKWCERCNHRIKMWEAEDEGPCKCTIEELQAAALI